MSNPESAGKPFGFEIPDDPSGFVEYDEWLMGVLMRAIRANLLRLDIRPDQSQLFSYTLDGGHLSLFAAGWTLLGAGGPPRVSQRIVVNRFNTSSDAVKPGATVDDYIVRPNYDAIIHAKSYIPMSRISGEDQYKLKPDSGPLVLRYGDCATVYRGSQYESHVLAGRKFDPPDVPSARELLGLLAGMSEGTRDNVASFSYAISG